VSPKDVTAWTREDYERAAQEYLESLPLEHFMEATPHAMQRKITLESLDLLTARGGRIQVCNELLVQYPKNGEVGQVVPDNMVLRRREAIPAMGSFNTPFEEDEPFWVLEYVSPSNKRKDYEDNYRKYERELRVSYYLIFDPETHDLRLYRHNGVAYEAVAPNAAGRLAVPELEVEVAVLDGWARYWYRGELLPLPGELQSQLDEANARAEDNARRAEQAEEQARQARDRAEEERRRAEQAERRQAESEAEVARLRALVAQLQAQPPEGPP
jgi:Uma2 family endonuclease